LFDQERSVSKSSTTTMAAREKRGGERERDMWKEGREKEREREIEKEKGGEGIKRGDKRRQGEGREREGERD